MYYVLLFSIYVTRTSGLSHRSGCSDDQVSPGVVSRCHRRHDLRHQVRALLRDGRGGSRQQGHPRIGTSHSTSQLRQTIFYYSVLFC